MKTDWWNESHKTSVSISFYFAIGINVSVCQISGSRKYFFGQKIYIADQRQRNRISCSIYRYTKCDQGCVSARESREQMKAMHWRHTASIWKRATFNVLKYPNVNDPYFFVRRVLFTSWLHNHMTLFLFPLLTVCRCCYLSAHTHMHRHIMHCPNVSSFCVHECVAFVCGIDYSEIYISHQLFHTV